MKTSGWAIAFLFVVIILVLIFLVFRANLIGGYADGFAAGYIEGTIDASYAAPPVTVDVLVRQTRTNMSWWEQGYRDGTVGLGCYGLIGTD